MVHNHNFGQSKKRSTIVVLNGPKLQSTAKILDGPKLRSTTVLLDGPKLLPTSEILDCLNKCWSKFKEKCRPFGRYIYIILDPSKWTAPHCRNGLCPKGIYVSRPFGQRFKITFLMSDLTAVQI